MAAAHHKIGNCQRQQDKPARDQEVGHADAKDAQQPVAAQDKDEPKRECREQRIAQLSIALGSVQIRRPCEDQRQSPDRVHRDEDRYDYPRRHTQRREQVHIAQGSPLVSETRERRCRTQWSGT
jgi:predicted secreted protein